MSTDPSALIGQMGVGALTDEDLQKLKQVIAQIAAGSGGGGGAPSPVQSVNGKIGAVLIISADIPDLPQAILAHAPVTSVAGRDGAVALSASDIGGLATAIASQAPVTSVNGQTGAVNITSTAPVTSVAGRTGQVTLSAMDIYQFASSAAAAAPVSSVANKTGAIALVSSDITDFAQGVMSAAPVRSVNGQMGYVTINIPVDSVAGKTGAVTLLPSDIINFDSAAAASAPVQSVSGRSGAVTLAYADISDFASGVAAAAPVTSVNGQTGSVTVSTNVSGSSMIAPTGRTVTRSVADLFAAGANARVTVEQFGNYNDMVIGTNSISGTDQAPYFQAALDYLASVGGGVLELDVKWYYLKTPVYVPAQCVIRGKGWIEGSVPSNGTWLCTDTLGLNMLNYVSSAANGSVITDVAFWQLQPAGSGNKTSGWAPRAYGWAIFIHGTYGTVTLDNIFLSQCTKGIRQFRAGRVHVNKVLGQCFQNFMYIDACEDESHVGIVRNWTYNSSADVRYYMENNLDLWYLGRCDGLDIDQTFSYECRRGFHMVMGTTAFDVAYTLTTNADTPSGSTTLNVPGGIRASGARLIQNGQQVQATGIPAGTSVTAVTATSVTLSAATTVDIPSGTVISFGFTGDVGVPGFNCANAQLDQAQYAIHADNLSNGGTDITPVIGMLYNNAYAVGGGSIPNSACIFIDNCVSQVVCQITSLEGGGWTGSPLKITGTANGIQIATVKVSGWSVGVAAPGVPFCDVGASGAPAYSNYVHICAGQIENGGGPSGSGTWATLGASGAEATYGWLKNGALAGQFGNAPSLSETTSTLLYHNSTYSTTQALQLQVGDTGTYLSAIQNGTSALFGFNGWKIGTNTTPAALTMAAGGAISLSQPLSVANSVSVTFGTFTNGPGQYSSTGNVLFTSPAYSPSTQYQLQIGDSGTYVGATQNAPSVLYGFQGWQIGTHTTPSAIVMAAGGAMTFSQPLTIANNVSVTFGTFTNGPGQYSSTGNVLFTSPTYSSGTQFQFQIGDNGTYVGAQYNGVSILSGYNGWSIGTHSQPNAIAINSAGVVSLANVSTTVPTTGSGIIYKTTGGALMIA